MRVMVFFGFLPQNNLHKSGLRQTPEAGGACPKTVGLDEKFGDHLSSFLPYYESQQMSGCFFKG